MPSLVVTVDTEEEGLWGGEYRRTGNTVENVRGVPRFQALCERFGIRPTYLVDAPVVDDDRAADILQSIHAEGRCEIGTHVHPWCNPPYEEEITERNSFLCNLPESLQRRKIEWLTGRIEERFGRRPTSFRAGRYGLDAAGARILADLGYNVDSSVIPFTDYSAQGGPNFDAAPCAPYVVAEDDLTRPARAGRLLEAPVTVGYSRKNFEGAHAARKRAMASRWRKLRLVGLLDRLGIARRIKLSPEQADAKAMIRLIDASIARGAECLVLMFHSSSLLPGHSPYVRDASALEGFLDRLASLFEHAVEGRGCSQETLTGIAERLPARSARDLASRRVVSVMA
ncbi:MAG: polysaccharide deacetylase family protein [Planctomycetaceae bacterium]